ncbi:tetratricopeptide repeat protein [Xanthovirga aplysinae]|uniref:tetratricopeptide repeat protein n=1 Tax=Xanthovirga aplysinae TaxID=2529853 RepID=UPI0012BB5440|nr:tetratricopeptide repeat protein [Xanthovirga aplysinae]MTI31169.1 tetratricopeptide repeat protein [Xanthovirga aplysinae]
MNKFIKIALAATLLSTKSLAQDISIGKPADKLFKEGFELFQKENYSPARQIFESYLSSSNSSKEYLVDAQYYLALSALRLGNPDGEYLIENFVESFPKNSKARLAYFELGNFYFSQKGYAKAIKYYEKADDNQLNEDQLNQKRFQLGYALFSRKKYEEALENFNLLKRSENSFTYSASYYAGFIAYSKEEYERALLDLEKAGKVENYASVVPSFITNIYYKQNQFEKLINYANDVLESKPKPQNSNQINLLLAESYYQKEDYSAAANHFSEYLRTKGVKVDQGILYRAAYAQYESGANDKAIKNFEKVAAKNDTISQYASYYLGALYLKNENKQFALAAFNKAVKSKYNETISEEALINFAKLNYELGNSSEAIDSFTEFLDRFPASKHKEEANELLSEAYLNTNNYAKAIQHIESLKNKSYIIRKAYQKVTYLRGTQLFNLGKYYQSVQHFKKSLEFSIDREMVVMANFWSGEAYSIGKKFEEAINSYAAVFRNSDANNEYYLKARYGIAYAYYNSKQYDKALVHFKHYISGVGKASDQLFYEDALIRLADCYYAIKGYSDAISYYDQAIAERNPASDYAYLQKGIILGVQEKLPDAYQSLDKVLNNYPDSRFVAQALFYKAQFAFEKGNYQVAINGFTHLISKSPQSQFIPYALLRRAISNTNLQNYDLAIKDYKNILNKFISHELANDALLGLQEALAQVNRSGEFASYLASFKKANPENQSVANITFESAKSLYYNQNYTKAIASFNDFLVNYPDNSLTYEAKYFIADSYYRQKQMSEAINYFEMVVDDNQTKMVNRSLQRMADIYFGQRELGLSIKYYRQLSSLANSRKEQYNAWAGQMEAYYLMKQYDSTAYFADQIIAKGNVAANALNKAQLFLGKAAYAEGDYDKAVDEFLATLNSAKDVNGAEAQYLMAEIFYEKGLYKQSLEALFELNDQFSVYTNWLGKGFLLIADNYIAMGEFFQARATLNSVVEKSNLSEVVKVAHQKLQKLDELERQKELQKKQKEEQVSDSLKQQEVTIEDSSLDSIN